MVRPKPIKIFESHTKDDTEFCDIFDRACARVGIDAFRSEYEHVKPPAWQTIRDELRQSKALFLLVGKALVDAQAKHDAEWEYTQNWISYEIGIASQLDLDIWVLCDNVTINFPVPYFNNYSPWAPRDGNFDILVSHLQWYLEGNKFDIDDEHKITCPNPDCSLTYNLYSQVSKGSKIVCPCCLKYKVFKDDFPLK